MLEKLDYMVMLNDFYGPLLTPKQQEILSLYYENDWSLTEIAREKNITKQAVHDLIRRAEKSLQGYETRLGLVEKFQKTRRQLEAVYDLLNHSEDREAINQAAQILKAVAGSAIKGEV
ncbi:MAG TPA: DNA-binding protein [Syntrophomonas sp.]|jgi:hypothetical protein|nr:DNA-binding protein [Syntrophomonas sp.]